MALKRILIAGLLISMIGALTIQADFVQCDASGNCPGTPNVDLINGTIGEDTLDGEAGNDIMFGSDGIDELNGADGDDIAFGGAGSDSIATDNDNDIIFPGPDDFSMTQFSGGGGGNDVFNVLVGETQNCQLLRGGSGLDTVNLIGFGPHVLTHPFSADPIAPDSVLILQDPIALGYIFILVTNQDTSTVELINGMPTPTATIVDNATWNQFQGENCMSEY
jgi:hypothetical protein